MTTFRRLRGLGWVILVPFSLWCLVAILLGGGGPDGISGARWIVALLFATSAQRRWHAAAQTTFLCASAADSPDRVKNGTDTRAS